MTTFLPLILNAGQIQQLQATPANGQVPIGNGTNLTLSSLTGTSNQVNVANAAGSITLSLPQSVHTGATPQFAGLGIGAAPGGIPLAINISQNGTTNFAVYNTNAGANAACGATFNNGTANTYFLMSGSGLPDSAYFRHNGAVFYNDANGPGLDFAAAAGTGNLKFWTGGSNLRLTIGSDGNLLFGTTTTPSEATVNQVFGGGTTSPVLGAATTDMASIAAVDNGAANRELQIQPEKGGFLAYGNDTLRRMPNSNREADQILAAVTTTDGTQTTVLTIAIAAGTTYQVEARIVARRTGGSSGTADDGASYARRATYTTKSGTVTLMGSVQTIGTDAEDQAPWDVTFTISSTNVLVRVTGAANNNISWLADVSVLRIAS